METPILNYFIQDNELKSSCDYTPDKKSQVTTFYEVIRVIDGVPLFVEDHVLRLFNSITLAGKSVRTSSNDITDRILFLIESNKISIGNIKFQFDFTQNNGYSFIAIAVPFNYPSEETLRKGVVVESIDVQRSNPHQKVMNHTLRNEIDRQKVKKDVFEMIHSDSLGNISEGSKSNIFFVKEKRLITPPIEKVLPGITRQKIIELAVSNHISFAEENINLNELDIMEGAFLSGTSLKVLPIRKFNDVMFTTDNHLIISMLNLYNVLILQYIDKYKHTS